MTASVVSGTPGARDGADRRAPADAARARPGRRRRRAEAAGRPPAGRDAVAKPEEPQRGAAPMGTAQKRRYVTRQRDGIRMIGWCSIGLAPLVVAASVVGLQ